MSTSTIPTPPATAVPPFVLPAEPEPPADTSAQLTGDAPAPEGPPAPTSRQHGRNQQMSFSQWWPLQAGIAKYERDAPAVYQLADALWNVLYTGRTGTLRRQLMAEMDVHGADPRRADAVRYRFDYQDWIAESQPAEQTDHG
jgi:hypothetical protein